MAVKFVFRYWYLVVVIGLIYLFLLHLDIDPEPALHLPSYDENLTSAFHTPSYDKNPTPTLNSTSYKIPSQKWIRSQLNKFYESIHSTYRPPNKWRRVEINQTYYFPRLNLFFTGVPKTGCSHWKEALLIAEGALPGRLSYLPDVHSVVSYKYRMPVYSKRWNLRDTVRTREAVSLLVLRNPWVRAMSAYRQKLSNEKTQGNAIPHLKYFILRFTRKIPMIEKSWAEFSGEPTLEEFVRYTTTKKISENWVLHDIHFRPQYTFISPERVRYDYVIPIEFVESMSRDFFTKTGLDIRLPGSYDKESDPRLQSSVLKAKEMFSKLDPELIDKFYNVYKKDFMLLNYSNFTDPSFPFPILN